jgi:hypothetical protein
MNLITLPTLFKGILLLIIALYFIFAFMLYNQVQALSKVVFFPAKNAGTLIKLFAIFYVLAIISLFFITLVIV